MATLTLSRGINQAGDTATVYDETDYVALSITRADIALVLLVKYKKSSGAENISVAAYDPADVALDTWSFNVNVNDGIYEQRLFGMPKYVAQTSGIVYKDGEVQKWDGAAFQIITDDELWLETTQHYGDIFSLITTQLQIKRDEAAEVRLVELEKALDGEDDNQYHKKDLDFSYIEALLQGANYDFAFSEYVNAQLKVETGINFSTAVLNQA